ncbi:MAG TPA: LysM domain-containing protein [Kofleriaceae bacterium]|nr:LysM domain-containing protein [Kofleriaceae bacterium]
MTSTRVRLALAGIAGATAVALAAPARAQVPTVEPDGSLADPAAPPPAPPPTPIIITPQGQPDTAPAPAGAPRGGYYHSDENGGPMGDQENGEVIAPGSVPAVHVVRSGDTLWDLSWSYFNNPWEWPRVWSYNPEITNPHWIYPGDQVRLRGAGQGAPPDRGKPTARAPAPRAEPAVGAFDMRQMAFLASDELALGIRIDGSPEEKLMLAAGDEAYLTYPEGKPPRVGQRYAIYLERERIEHPDSGEELGAFVRIVGELEVISAARGKRSRAVLFDTVEPIERGMAVGPAKRQFRNVDTTPAEADLEGIIVAELRSEELIGARQVVFIDRGANHRVRVGNRLHVIRRGDAYEPHGPYRSVGMNDTRYPARSIGEIMVVQTGKQTSIAVVVRSDKEFGVGDRVLMNRARNRSRSR